jgi:flagellar biosynthesis protein FliR
MYVYVMYYSIAVVTTIAYGDVTPKNPIEVMFTILALIFQTVLWGYILSEILRLLVNIYTYNFERSYYHYALNFKLKESKIS